MKLERAQEIYSDYEEGSLSPAMKLALEQHFEADPSAKRDFDEFSQVVGLISASMTEEVDAPHGFRAKVLERVAREGQHQAAVQSGGFVAALRNVLTMPRRREAVVALSFAVVVAVAVAFKPFAMQSTVVQIPVAQPTEDTVPTVIKGLDTQIVSNTVYHNLTIHLPDDAPNAVVNAYAFNSADEILDPGARDRDAVRVLTNEELTNDEGETIPLQMSRPAKSGSALVILLDWTIPGSTVPKGTDVVFTPFNPDDSDTPSTAAPSDGNFLESLQTISAAYHTTIIADMTVPPAAAVSAWQPGTDVQSALDTVAKSAGYTVQKISDKSQDSVDPATYVVYRASQSPKHITY